MWSPLFVLKLYLKSIIDQTKLPGACGGIRNKANPIVHPCSLSLRILRSQLRTAHAQATTECEESVSLRDAGV